MFEGDLRRDPVFRVHHEHFLLSWGYLEQVQGFGVRVRVPEAVL